MRKSGEMSGTRTVRPVSDKLVIDIDMDSDTAAESDFSLKSRSFLNRVNDRLRKMLNRSPEDSMQNIDKRSVIGECLCLRQWKHLHSWERIAQTICIPTKIKGNLTLKQMFEISEQLLLEQSNGIFGNLPKADVQFSVLRLHYPEINSEAKDMEKCRIPLLPLRQQLKLFFA